MQIDDYFYFFIFIQTEQGEIWGTFYSKMSEESLKYPIDQIKDPEIKLQLISLQDKGSGALSPDKASRVRPSSDSLLQIYIKCSFKQSQTSEHLNLAFVSSCSWIKFWVIWAPSTAHRRCVSQMTRLTVKLWSQVQFLGLPEKKVPKSASVLWSPQSDIVAKKKLCCFLEHARKYYCFFFYFDVP